VVAQPEAAVVTAKAKVAKPWISGFCGPGNDQASHARCDEHPRADGKPCDCPHHAAERTNPIEGGENERDPHTLPAQPLTPGSPEWCRRVSPSKAAAILGISPWDSQRAMWHKMRAEIPWDEETEAMERGTLCEPAVLAWWRKHHEHTDWREQVTLTIGDWCVATPDAIAHVTSSSSSKRRRPPTWTTGATPAPTRSPSTT
jgi:hypothetical protein